MPIDELMIKHGADNHCKRVFAIPLLSMEYYLVNFETVFSLLLIPVCSLSVVFFVDVFRFYDG